jgi:hypothetical protein
MEELNRAANELELLGNKELASSITRLISGECSLDDVFKVYYEDLSVATNEGQVSKTRNKKNKSSRDNNSKKAGGKNPTGKGDEERRPHTSATLRRMSEFAKNQNLWKKNRRALWREIRNGSRHEGNLSAREAYIHFNEKFSLDSLTDNEPSINLSDPNTKIWDPITLSEIETAISKQKNKAPGLDVVTYRSLVKSKIQTLAMANSCMYARTIPKDLRSSRTILIAKKQSDDPGDYRPITISSAILRVLNSVLASRISESVKFNPSQRGFIKGDGAMENTLLLDYIIRKSRQGICLATVDVSKAFDSVSINSILRAARNFGMPEGMCEYLANIYAESDTVIDYKHVLSEKIRVKIGVKQGDPLSPLLFNMVIDEFFRKIPPNLGVKVGEQAVFALAFADDLVLISDTESGLRDLLLKCEQFYAKRGLRLNPDKTVLMTRDKTNKLYISNINVAGVRPHSLSSGEFFRYLGVQFDPSGRTAPNKTALTELLEKLTKAKLRPNQRLYFLRHHLIPTLLHELVLGRATAGLLDTWDGLIKHFLKRHLKLDHWIVDGIIHLPNRKGGLGIPLLRQYVPKILLKRLTNLKASDNPYVIAYCRTHEFDKLINHVTRLTRIRDGKQWDKVWDFSTASEIERYWIEKTAETSDGRAIRTFGKVPLCNEWMTGKTNKFKGSEFIRAVQMRCNALPCGANARRFCRNNRSDFVGCRYGCRYNEGLAHILNGCDKTRSLQSLRHDNILTEIVRILNDKGHLVMREPTLTQFGKEGARNFKPDIVVKFKNSSNIYVLDVGVAWETSDYTLPEVEKLKRNLYSPIKLEVFDLVGRAGVIIPEESPYMCYGIIFGARGAIGQRSFNLLRGIFDFNKSQIRQLCELAITGSIKVWKFFVKDSGHRPKGKGNSNDKEITQGPRKARERVQVQQGDMGRAIGEETMSF